MGNRRRRACDEKSQVEIEYGLIILKEAREMGRPRRIPFVIWDHVRMLAFGRGAQPWSDSVPHAMAHDPVVHAPNRVVAHPFVGALHCLLLLPAFHLLRALDGNGFGMGVPCRDGHWDILGSAGLSLLVSVPVLFQHVGDRLVFLRHHRVMIMIMLLMVMVMTGVFGDGPRVATTSNVAVVAVVIIIIVVNIVVLVPVFLVLVLAVAVAHVLVAAVGSS
mmetsp:Transcript_25756/g.71934  ORF Transcript_25756/g.71934 Transcript_25756/m.71934 type:complete len:219 (+) Transcript_25756:358-1014(+)